MNNTDTFTQLPEWKALAEHFQAVRHLCLRELFADDAGRFARLSMQFGGIFADFSKNLITRETVRLLCEVARARGVVEATERMFGGQAINATENRAALHTALRCKQDEVVLVEGKNVVPEVHRVLRSVGAFSSEVRSGGRRGYTGKVFTDIVNIGIGGSDLGPKFVCEALKWHSKRDLKMHFVSNVDGTHLAETLRQCHPETTLFIISSKTFTTEETMTNARSSRTWFLESGAMEGDVQHHFAAVSTNFSATAQFGISPENVFIFWDWVGGRYSLWSAIGLSVALSVGYEHFTDLLAGARAMDEHFRTAAFEENIPVLAAMLGVWYGNFFGSESHAVLPYDEYLRLLPSFLQQLDMESNGKSTMLSGGHVPVQTAPVVWGQPGTDSQHSFFQLLHQGTRFVPCDFIAAAAPLNPLGDHHDRLLANFFAQTEALMRGKTESEALAELRATGMNSDEAERLAPHKVFAGNHPSTTILLDKLTPFSLGALLAMYEHKVFVQGVVWGINSFDQWGVELGKQLAKAILPELQGGETGQHDGSTLGLLEIAKSLRISKAPR